MVQLTFANGDPNISIEIGDLVYYISNPNTNYEGSGFVTGDGAVGQSTMVLIGPCSAIHLDNDPSQLTTVPEGATNTFTIFCNNIDAIIPPQPNDYIFFIKDNDVELSSVLGYYSKVTMRNNSTAKAELFAVSSDYSNSSK
tara:strand:- start:17867 stop:18289 length:423 start_codon:yes stop_codon:yes gene_type:complete